MKRKMTFAMLAAASLLLTSCGSSSQTTGESAAGAASSAAESSAAETSAADTTEASKATETQDSAQQTSASETKQTTAAAESSAAQSETTLTEQTKAQDLPIDQPVDILAIVKPNTTNPLNCTGTVFAKSGLNVRLTPSKDGKILTLLKDGTKVKIKGLTVTEEPYFWESRWYQIEYNGQIGYVSTSYVVAVCTTPAEKMTVQERATLGTALYYQADYLSSDFHRGASVMGASYSDEYDDTGYCRLKPDGLTLDKLRKEYQKYFVPQASDNLAEYYIEKDGSLWCLTGYGDNVAVAYVEPCVMTKQEEKELSYLVKTHYNTAVFEPEEHAETEDFAFSLVYRDGVWKVNTYTPQY